jgi:hypothetical protein
VKPLRREIFEHLYITYGVIGQKAFKAIPLYSDPYTVIYFSGPQTLKCSTVKILTPNWYEEKVRLAAVDFFYDDNQGMWFDTINLSTRTDLDFNFNLYGIQYFLMPGTVYDYPEILQIFKIKPLDINIKGGAIASI